MSADYIDSGYQYRLEYLRTLFFNGMPATMEELAMPKLSLHMDKLKLRINTLRSDECGGPCSECFYATINKSIASSQCSTFTSNMKSYFPGGPSAYLKFLYDNYDKHHVELEYI